MIRNTTFRISDQEAGERLDRTVARRVPNSTRALILDAISAGRIQLNGRRADKGIKVRAGDEIRVQSLLERADNRAHPNPALPLTILHEDATLLVLDKPAGMPVHPLAAEETDTLANALVAYDPALAAIGDDPLFPALVHRLDTGTSGVMLAARTAEAYAFLREEFHVHRVEKEYRALVHGEPPASGRLEHYLAHHPARPGFMRVFAERPARYAGPRLLQAVTEFTVITRYPGHALLSVRIPTGVTHQIRAQLAAFGHPIVGDALYGSPAADGEHGLGRHFLHAATIACPHPATREQVRFTAPLPAELSAVLAKLAARA